MVILVTGKKDAGKTTYAKRLVQELIDSGVNAALLDGDEFRAETGNDDFTDEGRQRNLVGAAKVAAELERQGNIVVVAFVSPRKVWREAMRLFWKESRVVYLPGGTLWPNTIYEIPDEEEIEIRRNK
jgi:adenylylsulfate kinase/bifunctional enzyme CysN/CysC